ncbi:MAG: response regulator, partial [Bifidobacteriaceae bacterium]|nr:response regulator [Bifidobacteriaceae bacterium]
MSQRILVVDDDPELAEVLLIALAKYGFDATACTDGAAALSEFERYRPDLVLLDVMLPGLDGLEVCRRIVARSSVPIIMLTARTDTADKVAALDGGAIDYVVKPPDLTELVAR